MTGTPKRHDHATISLIAAPPAHAGGAAGDRPARLPSLTGMRFIAAFMVLICHIGIVLVPRVDKPWLEWSDRYLYTAGTTGVVFFFVLSGFVLTWVARPGDAPGRFWRRRLVKIFPNHLVTLAAVTVLMLVYGNPVTVANTVPTVFLVQSWIPDQEVVLNFSSNAPTWSLACELLFYLAFPALLALVRRIPAARLWLWTAVVAVAVATVPFLGRALPDRPIMLNTTEPWWAEWFGYYFPLVRALEFLLGMLMARIVLSGRWIPLGLAPAAVLATLSYVVASEWLPDSFSQASGIAFFLALLIAAGARADTEGRRTLLRGPKMTFLGEISFALYMVHWLVLAYGPIGMAEEDGWTSVSTLPRALAEGAATVAISLASAWLLHVAVERPAMRRWSGRR